ncbi:hypothetical protein ACJDU8_09930 [Clostridium sp. WILCCON 0269]|uniref:Prepilin type IV endopeptidase peptidase domain-containing protein n=1 Tax=Candidatus Clostridium eludens TaxID=3381663 RepID=A0ABW8SL11_9CLOT
MAFQKIKIDIYFHLLFVTIITIIISNVILFFAYNKIVLIVCSGISLIFMLAYLRSYFDRQKLLVMSRVVFIIGVVLGITIGNLMDSDIFLGVLIAVPLADMLSFTKTKVGENSTNARILKNFSLAPKLVIYVKKKKDHLIPLIGVGDICFYSLLISFVHKLSSKLTFRYDIFLIMGCLFNCILIMLIHRKKWFKGFPATSGPAVLTFVFFLCNKLF